MVIGELLGSSFFCTNEFHIIYNGKEDDVE